MHLAPDRAATTTPSPTATPRDRGSSRGRRPRPHSLLDIGDGLSARSPRGNPFDEITLNPPSSYPARSPSPVMGRSPSPLRNPFNFESVPITSSPAPARPNQRRGHRYKHSSVSINFFQEPEVRNPLAIPVSHEIPTFTESWQSATKHQTANLAYALLRIALVWALFTGPHITHSTSALAHLVAYDVVAHVTVVAVDVLGNFEVWKQSSLRLPFALQRSEVLVGFALSITLVFFGFDIFSHVIQDIAQQLAGDHDSHSHHHGRPDDVDQHSLVALVLCLINTLTVVARLWQLDNPWAENTIAFVTAAYCLVVMITPYLGPVGPIVDTVLTPIMALSMVYFGWQVSKYFGGMLVMSHVGPDNTSTLEEALMCIPNVVSVSEISIWQVHHDLWLGSVKIVMSGTDEDESKAREEAEQKMREILAQDTARIETTIDITRTTLD